VKTSQIIVGEHYGHSRRQYPNYLTRVKVLAVGVHKPTRYHDGDKSDPTTYGVGKGVLVEMVDWKIEQRFEVVPPSQIHQSWADYEAQQVRNAVLKEQREREEAEERATAQAQSDAIHQAAADLGLTFTTSPLFGVRTDIKGNERATEFTLTRDALERLLTMAAEGRPVAQSLEA
jgi:hypothetical protein